MQVWKINQSVTVNLPTFVSIHICPQACRHGVTCLVWSAHIQAACSRCGLSLKRSGHSAADVVFVWSHSTFGFLFRSSRSTWQLLHLSSPFGMLFFFFGLFFFFHWLFEGMWSDHICFCSVEDMNKMAGSWPFLQFHCRNKTLNILYDRM